MKFRVGDRVRVPSMLGGEVVEVLETGICGEDRCHGQMLVFVNPADDARDTVHASLAVLVNDLTPAQ